jgi:acetyl esterase/lipase
MTHRTKTCFLTIYLALYIGLAFAQTENDSTRQAYLAEQKTIGRAFSGYFYPNYSKLYSLTEREFVSKIDSARDVFNALTGKYKDHLDSKFVNNQNLEVKYYFDKILVDYPNNHDTYQQTGKETIFSGKLSKRIQSNLTDFNEPELLANPDFKEYAKSYFHYLVDQELAKGNYKNTDNQTLNAIWKLIPSIVSNETCREFWQTEYLFYHIDNNGIKNIENILAGFRLSCKEKSYLKKINGIYSQDSIARQGHTIKAYKSVNGLNLDLHLFLPDSAQFPGKRPVYVYFHGGSWSEGKPDWGFSSCESYSKKGWIGVSVEYRTASRHNTLPFESVMDARSVIRWLRKNADLYNIDPSKIVATGNSAGGHLVLTTALADKWNEKTDDLTISPTPNILLVNSAAYDLTIENTKWITKKLKNKEWVKEISPNHLVKKGMPPLLVAHGTNDKNCPLWTAENFRKEMEDKGNEFEFHVLEGADHYIWYNPACSGQIAAWRKDFLSKLSYK